MMAGARHPLLVVAGEASGDFHGARLLAELGELLPGVDAFGLGGEEMRQAGLDLVAHASEISVVGIIEALRVLPRAREIFAELLTEVERRRPRAAVLIDFPEFNLRLAAKLTEQGIPVAYYISPQVWAWRKRRVRTIAERVDKMLVLFPFEREFYRHHGVDVTHVGHPLVDEVPELAPIWERGEAEDGPFQVALLPGSRPSELEALLPVMLESMAQLDRTRPVRVKVLRAPGIPPWMVEEQVEASGVSATIVGEGREERFRAIADSHIALCASGTATLEVGLLGTPLVVLYRLAGWTYLLARLLVRLPHVSLVNLVLGREVVPELIQHQANPQRIAREVEGLVTDRERIETMRRGLAELRGRLGEPGASRRAAQEVANLFEEGVPA